MDDDEPRSPALTLRVVYDDSHLIEVKVRVVAGDWSGTTRAYTTPGSLGDGARDLLAWSARPHEPFALEAGSDTGIGWVSLRWRTIDRSGHLVCHVRFATAEESDRPEGVRRLALQFPTELGLVERFARQLMSIAESLTGEAVLDGR
jgi:hypothetical protein